LIQSLQVSKKNKKKKPEKRSRFREKKFVGGTACGLGQTKTGKGIRKSVCPGGGGSRGWWVAKQVLPAKGLHEEEAIYVNGHREREAEKNGGNECNRGILGEWVVVGGG